MSNATGALTPGAPPDASTNAPIGSIARRFRRSFANSASGLVVSFAAFFAISRLVDPREYGRVAVITAVWGLSFNAVDWCGMVPMRFGPSELLQKGTLRATLSARLVFAIPPLALTVIVAPLFLLPGLAPWAARHEWTPPMIALGVAWMFSSTAMNVLSWSAIAAQRFVTLAVANGVVKGLPLLAILGAHALGRPVTAEVIVVGITVGIGGGAAILFLALRPLLGLERPDFALVRSMWRFALPGLFGVPAQAAITWLDPLLLDYGATKADVGRYQLAYPTFTVFAAIGAALNGVLSPELVRNGDAAAIARYRDGAQPTAARLLCLGSFGGALLAGPIVAAVLPSAYAASADVVALLCVAGGFLLGVWTLHPLVNATDSMWSLQAATLLQAITNVALDLLLMPSLGGRGIAIANVAAWAVSYVSLALLLRRAIGVHAATVLGTLLLGGAVTAMLVWQPPALVLVTFGAVLLAIAARGGLAAWRDQRAAATTGLAA